MDDYLPVGYVVWHGLGAGVNAFFWALAAGVLVVVFLVWFALLTFALRWRAKRRAQSQ